MLTTKSGISSYTGIDGISRLLLKGWGGAEMDPSDTTEASRPRSSATCSANLSNGIMSYVRFIKYDSPGDKAGTHAALLTRLLDEGQSVE